MSTPSSRDDPWCRFATKVGSPPPEASRAFESGGTCMQGRGLRVARGLGCAVVALIVGPGALPAVAGAASSSTGGGVTVRAGTNAKKDSTVAVLEYLPKRV